MADPGASLKFYKTLGMSVLQEVKLPDYDLELYFIAYGRFSQIWTLEPFLLT